MDREGRNRRKRRGRVRAVAAVAVAAAAVTATGGTKGGKGEILLTYTPTSGGPRAARPANARPGAREKERRQQRLGISPVARAQKAP